MKITVTRTAKYSKNHNQFTRRILDLAEQMFPLFYNYLDLPPQLSLVIRPIREKHVVGLCWWTEEIAPLVSIDCRQRPTTAMRTLAHELVHIEQFHSGKLEYKWAENHMDWEVYWLGKNIGFLQGLFEGSTYSQAHLPWEMEAEKKGKIVYKQVVKLI